MKEIQLTKGVSTLVDDWNYDWLNQWKWYAKESGNLFYASRIEIINGKRILISMHRIINKTPINLECDHIDHNTLNNQEYNLRNATDTQNAINRIYPTTTGYRGVHFSKYHNKFQAQILIKGKKKHLGYFNNPIEAAKKYDIAARKYHGEFAIVNFI